MNKKNKSNNFEITEFKSLCTSFGYNDGLSYCVQCGFMNNQNLDIDSELQDAYSSGSIINKNPQHLWDYNLNNFDHSNLLHGIESLVRANYLAGAEEIMVAASPTMHWKKSSNENIDDFVNKIKAIKNEPFRMLLGSAHQMGTARINPNPEHGVVDLDGKVHGLENVYIVDASTFPRCSGVNPMISIQSMSHFLMSKI